MARIASLTRSACPAQAHEEGTVVFDGGYGATVHVRESLLNDVVGAVHFALGDQLSTTTSGAISVGGTQIKYSGSVYLDRPLIALRHADAAARADLTVRARLSLGPVEVTSVVQATALVPIRLGPATPDWSAPLYLDLSTLTLQSARISSATVDGQPLPPAALSDQLTAALVDAIRPLAGDRLRFAVPLTALSDMQFAAAEAGAVVPALRPVAVVVLEQSVVACFDCVGPFDD